MRTVKHPQHQLDQIDIASIEFDARSRDDIPAILKDLQYLYVNEPIREKVFTCLEKALIPETDLSTGRPGMELWNIFVLATVKLAINCDFERLQDLANQHAALRQMLGHSGWENPHRYALQTLIDLESRGLDRCLFYGKQGFERHVGLSIVATNVHRLGLVLQRQERDRLRKEKQREQRRLLAA